MFDDIELAAAFEQYARRVEIEEDFVLMEPDQVLRVVPIVIRGCIRVLRQNAEAEETFLYHIMPGETCALSLSCCSTNKRSGVKAVAEMDTEFWAVPIRFVEEWQKHLEWREFIARTFQNRFEQLLNVIDDIAFRNMDERLWSYLLARSTAQNSTTLHVTHDEIAQELGVQREAVTRLVRKLKELHRIETGRNEIHILENKFSE